MKKTKMFSQVSVEKNAFVDNGDGLIKFKNGLTITDDTEQRNGTKYDIKSMNLDDYSGMLTANHSMAIQEVIGKTSGLKKTGNRVTIDEIQFALKENALARYAYNMMQAGYLKDFSIETFGPWPDEDGIYKNSNLVGLSLVVTGNNRSATINEAEKQVAFNSVEQAKKDGLDTSYIEENILCYNEATNINNLTTTNMFVTVKNSRDFAVTLKYKNAAGDEVEKELKAGETLDVSEDQKTSIESQISDAQAPQASVEDTIKNAMAPFMAKMTEMENKIFANSAQEPQFKKSVAIVTGKNALDGIEWETRTEMQINAAMGMFKGNMEEGKKLHEINAFHIDKLKEQNIVKNSVTMGDFGNFVISPELITEIQGFRSEYAPFLAKTDWKETLSLSMAWLNRSGDIDMQSVEMCDDGADGNLKPISDYSATIKTSALEELAAVTPVCNSATRFLAVDLLGDVAQGYRTDYDRKRAQLVIARMQQAVNETGYTSSYNMATDGAAIKSIITPLQRLAERTMNGSFVMNYATYWQLMSNLIGAGQASPLYGYLVTTGDQATLFGKPLVIVPDDLMPTLNTAGTKSFVVNGVTVTITQAIFYGDISKFTGRVSGGLQYDLSTEAAYEEGGVVKSAYQRNELVLRGSFFRGGAIKDITRFAGIGAPAIS